MKITITGSLGNIGKPLTEILVAAGHAVTVVSSRSENSQPIKTLGAIPAIGSIEDPSFLAGAFRGADAVFTLVPPNFTATDWKKYIAGIGKNYADALRQAGVRSVVNLSSIGAHLPSGTGPIAGLHEVEATLNTLEGVAVKHLRPAFFYTNFLHNIDMVRNSGILGSNYAAQARLVMVHPNDIAEVAAEEIQTSFSGHSIRYVASDEQTTSDVAAALGSAIGKPALPWVEFSDVQALEGMTGAGMPAEIARNYVEMGSAVRNGKLFEDYELHKPAVLGKTKLRSFAAEFADSYRQAANVA